VVVVGRARERLEMRRVCTHVRGVIFSCEQDEIPPLAGRGAHVVIREQSGKQQGSVEQGLLEGEDWAVVDVLAHLTEESDSERRQRLRECGQVGNDKPMRLSGNRPGSAGQARAYAVNQRHSDCRERRKIIKRAGQVREPSAQHRLPRRKSDNASHGDRLERPREPPRDEPPEPPDGTSVGEFDAASRLDRPLLGKDTDVSGNQVAHRHELHSIWTDLDAVADATVLPAQPERPRP